MAGTIGPSGDEGFGVEGLELRSRRENLRRNSFLIGLVILLVLIAGSGALAFRQFGRLEQEVQSRSETNARHLTAVVEVEQHLARLQADSSTYFTSLSLGADAGYAKRRMRNSERHIDAIFERERTSQLASMDEWNDFREAYAAYVADLEARQVPNEDRTLRERLDDATAALADRIKDNSERLNADAKTLRENAQKDVLVTTGICFLAGLAISLLAFTETRRRIEIVEGAVLQLVAWRQFTENVLDGMDSAVITVDDQGLVTTVNEPALYALGLASDADVIGRPATEIFEPYPALAAMVGPLAEEPVASRRYLGRVELGRGRWLFDVGASPLATSADGRGYILTMSDVTEAERANEELRRNRALTAVGQMTAQVAHEIKNPLGGVRLSAQLLERRLNDDPASLELIRRIENSIDHLARTVNELNQFARPSELRREPVSLAALLDDLLLAVGDKVKEKRIAVDRRYDAALPQGEWDAGELRKAFINFLANALDASPEGGRLVVSAEYRDQTAGLAVVTVRDEGVGMSEETVRRLFEPFYTTKAHGTGLGMSIARKIIELHKGTLEVSSREGEGTTVVVSLPLGAGDAAMAGGPVGARAES